MGITFRDFSGEGEGRYRGENVQGRRSMVSMHNVDRERLKNGMGNRGVKELLCTTHGHDLRGMVRGWGQGRGGIEGVKLGKL